LKKLIDGVAGDGHPISIGFAAKPSAAAGAKTGKQVPSEEVFDVFLRGLKEGWDAIPRTPEHFSSFARWWHSPPDSSDVLLYLLEFVAIVGVSALASCLILRLLRSGGTPLPAAEPAPLDQKMRPALVHLSKDIAAAAAFIVVASLLVDRVFNPL